MDESNLDKALLYIEKFYKFIREDENARYKSWENCHKYFITHKDKINDDIIDNMSLNLAWYLASWGMLRGSFLLQKSHGVHKEAIKIMLLPKYNNLWRISSEELIKNENIDLIFECKNEIKNAYAKQKHCNVPTDTLITKIFLGVYGCISAFDRYLKIALKNYGYNANFSKSSIRQLCKFCIDNKEFMINAKNLIGNDLYTEMKIVDMLFWQIGYDLEKGDGNLEKNDICLENCDVDLENCDVDLENCDVDLENCNVDLENRDVDLEIKGYKEQKNNQVEQKAIYKKTNNPSKKEVVKYLIRKLNDCKANGKKFLIVKAGDLAKEVNSIGALPTICSAMYHIQEQFSGEILHATPSGYGTTLTIRYNF